VTGHQTITHWCDIIVLNVYAPKEDKTDYVKFGLYEEMENVFNKFLNIK
jgi:5-methylcytosine-specific restriction endonuclease McrBC regulatory subunit McrC